MKKLILLSYIFIVSALIVFATPVLATVDLNERWTDGGGYEYKVQREGDTIKLTLIIPKQPRAAGIPSLVGTITGTTFTGQQYLLADDCPNLEGYVPASGSVSADGNSISVTYTSNDFYVTSCTIKRSFEDSNSYTKTSPQKSPTSNTSTQLTSPAPSEAPLNLNGTWTAVNSFGTTFTFSGHHSGNNLTLQITDASDVKNSIGKTSLSGTLSGHSFNGTQILIAYAPECLDTYFNVDATGTVAADGSSIAVSLTNFRYDIGTCAKISGTEFASSITYVRASAGQNPIRGEDITQVDPSPDISKTVEKPSVGVSSRDFQALVRANAEYQKAQADLEKIKADSDPRWVAKKDFVPTNTDSLDKTLEKVQGNLERIKDATSASQDVKEVYDFYKIGKFGEYTGLSFTADVANGVITFTDLVDRGVPVAHASTKAFIDTTAPTAFNLFPPLAALDKITTIPDRAMNAIGFNKKDPWRKYTTGLLKKYGSPSSFVETTTEAMVTTQNWLNFVGIYQEMINDVREAEGFGGKSLAVVEFTYTAIGSVPVAVAMSVKDKVETIISGGKSFVNFVSSWFTYPE